VVVQEVDATLEPLQRVVLTDGLCRTLFEQYDDHRRSERGDEETGWLLMGHRIKDEALALATLPAGAGAEAGVAHVRFNSEAQALASRILRQDDRRLVILGIVHTHPGTLRHPSKGDFQGDQRWVRLLRGKEGVFGIGTADGPAPDSPSHVAEQPKPHMQTFLGLRLTWYALAAADAAYRPLPVHLTLGPDLARPLHCVWPEIELHAARLDRLCRQLSRVHFDVIADDEGHALRVTVPLARKEALCAILREDRVSYGLERADEYLVSDLVEPQVDRGIYLLLAKLAEKPKGD
jgi:proteasome lid subunit RPN8/RPN11